MNQRHQLIYLKNKASFELTSTQANTPILYKAIQEWLNAGYPCVFARQNAQSSLINLGLTLLIEHKTYRTGILVDPFFIARASHLPTLNACALLFPRALPLLNESIYVYGSFLFQHLSQLAFIHSRSDLDILIVYQQTTLQQLTQTINNLTIATERVIDGEVRFHKIGDISITELIKTSSPQLLVKTTTNSFLISRQTLYEHYPSLLH